VSEQIYRRRAVSRRIWWWIPIVGWALGTIGLLVASPELSSFYLVMSVIAPGMIFGIWLLTLWSMNRYGDVTVTRESLRVGRESLPVASIDPAWVRMLASKASPELLERVTAAGGVPNIAEAERRKHDSGRLVGGAYASTLGAETVTLRLVTGARVSAPTGDRAGLLAALLTALDAQR
jgi:hypothetical protein